MRYFKFAPASFERVALMFGDVRPVFWRHVDEGLCEVCWAGDNGAFTPWQSHTGGALSNSLRQIEQGIAIEISAEEAEQLLAAERSVLA